MIVYEKDNQIALVTLIHDNGYIVSVYNSFEDFVSGSSPTQSYELNGTVNQDNILTILPNWQISHRDDNTWEKIN
jgi:hypothetical protein